MSPQKTSHSGFSSSSKTNGGFGGKRALAAVLVGPCVHYVIALSTRHPSARIGPRVTPGRRVGRRPSRDAAGRARGQSREGQASWGRWGLGRAGAVTGPQQAGEVLCGGGHGAAWPAPPRCCVLACGPSSDAARNLSTAPALLLQGLPCPVVPGRSVAVASPTLLCNHYSIIFSLQQIVSHHVL